MRLLIASHHNRKGLTFQWRVVFYTPDLHQLYGKADFNAEPELQCSMQ